MEKLKQKETNNKTLAIIITVIVAIILVGVGILLFRQFKFMPNATNEVLDEVGATTLSIKKNSKSLTDSILEDLSKKDETLNTIVNNGEKYYNNIYNRIVIAENQIKKTVEEKAEDINNNINNTR